MGFKKVYQEFLTLYFKWSILWIAKTRGGDNMGFSVKQARQYAGLTQRETAKKLGISRDSYRKMEIAPESASIALAKRFSEIVGIPIDQIFFTEKST